MSRVLAAALAALMLFAAVPASAQEVVPLACENAGNLEVITPAGLKTGIATPTFNGAGSESKDFLVDLGAASTEATAAVTGVLTWGLPVNDYDLQMDSANNSGVSEGYQPIDENVETVALDDVKHCEVITATAINFLAPVDIDELNLEFSVGPVTEPAPAAAG